MADFFRNMDYYKALDVERLSRLSYELRFHRTSLLEPYGVTDAVALLERIYAGELAEHPAYEHYLAARTLEETRETVRMLIADNLKEARTS